MINEGNKEDQYLEKKGESSKTTAIRKSMSRRHRFDTGTTHQNAKRENITWARPGTRSYDDSLNRQRKEAHRSARKGKKPKAGSSPEDRKWAKFSGDEPEGKYQKLQKQKKAGQRTNIEAQKQGLIRKGERRRQLRTQAVNAIRRAVGGGYVSEAKVDDYRKLSPIEKEFVRHKRQTGFEPGSDIDKHTETRRLVHREKRGVKKREPYRDGSSRLSSKYASKSQNQKRLKELQGKKTLRSTFNNIRDFERSTKTFEQFMTEAYVILERSYLIDEDFVSLTPEKEERVKKRVGELARDVQVSAARMKELKKKPFGRFRPKVKQEKQAILKSARKKQKQVRSASDALIDASISRSAKIQKRIQDLKGES